MTSSGPDHAHTGNTGTTGATGTSSASAGSSGSSTSRSAHRRRRHIHRRAAPPSARTLATQRTATSGSQNPDHTAEIPQSSRQNSGSTTTQTSRRPSRLPKTFLGDLPDAQAAPFVSLAIAASGIHPTTSRLVSVAAVLYDAEGKCVTFTGNRPASSSMVSSSIPGTVELTGVVQQINPGEDPGPWHLHGYTEAELGQAPGFATIAPLLFTLLNDRTVICHKASLTWGFIVQEYRRAQRAAQRSAPQSGNRGRRRNQRRPRKIAIPQPERIVETLGTSRRQSVPVIDPRLRSIAAHYREVEGLRLDADTLPNLGAVASAARADTNADELLLADARILMPLHLVQEDIADAGRGTIQSSLPEDLTADRFGLQRSTIRVDATTAPRPLENPGVPASTKAGTLTAGMEFVVSPDVATDPDDLIAAGLRAGLVYSEKLNRTSSLVVCNQNHELRGKAMHAHRKNIPLFSDTEFLAALDDVAEGTAATGKPETRPATPRIPAPQRGGQNRSRQGGNRSAGNRQGRSQGTTPGTRQGTKQGTKQGARQGTKQGVATGSTQGEKLAARHTTKPSAHQDNSRTTPATGAPETKEQVGSATPTKSGSNRNRSRNRNRRRPKNRQQNEHNQQRQQNQQGQQKKDTSTSSQAKKRTPDTGRASGVSGSNNNDNSRDNRDNRSNGSNAAATTESTTSQRSNRSSARRRRRSGSNRRRSNNNGNNGNSNGNNTNQPKQKGDQ